MLPSINIFGRELSMYAICACVGILICLFSAMHVASKRFRLDDNNILMLGLISAIGIFLGGHLVYGLTNFNYIIEVIQNFSQIDSLKTFVNCIFIIFGGQVFYGGLIGGLIAGYVYLKKTKKDVALYSYIVAPFIPLFHAFGRLGCFLGGCCYGIEWEHGITYHNDPIEIANGVPRLPIQLIEAAANLLIFAILYILQKKGKCKNSLLFIYLLSYSVVRFVDEFFRGDDYRGFIGPLSTSQVISIGIFIFALCAIIRLWIKNAKSASKPSA